MSIQCYIVFMSSFAVLLQCYIVFSEMEAAKKMDDSTAVVCAELSNHEVRNNIAGQGPSLSGPFYKKAPSGVS